MHLVTRRLRVLNGINAKTNLKAAVETVLRRWGTKNGERAKHQILYTLLNAAFDGRYHRRGIAREFKAAFHYNLIGSADIAIR